MKASIAISTTRDPLNGRFVQNHKSFAEVVTVGTSQNVERMVDLAIQRSGGPYIRMRMDVEAAREIATDLRNKADQAVSRAPEGAYRPFLVCRVYFHDGCVHAEVCCGAESENEAQLARDDLESKDQDGRLYMVLDTRAG